MGCRIVEATVLLLSGIVSPAAVDQNSPGKVDHPKGVDTMFGTNR
jgi:hypothetical protein